MDPSKTDCEMRFAMLSWEVMVCISVISFFGGVTRMS